MHRNYNRSVAFPIFGVLVLTDKHKSVSLELSYHFYRSHVLNIKIKFDFVKMFSKILIKKKLISFIQFGFSETKKKQIFYSTKNSTIRII